MKKIFTDKDSNLKSEYFVFFFLFLLGLCTRIIYLGVVPGGYQMDETYSAWNAFSLYHCGIDSAGYSYPVYFEAWGHGQSALNSYLMLPLIALAGGHVNLLIIRLPQIVLSAATLAASYSIMRKLFTPQAACWTLFLLAINPWHVMMSRWGLEANLAPGFLILGLAFFLYGLDRPKLLPLSALCYGLSLYCYAVIWPVVPVILLLQGIYGFAHKKLSLNRWTVLSTCIVFVLAAPLMLFLLVNQNFLPNIQLGPFSIYKMSYFRSNELAHSLKEVLKNIRNVMYLFYHQDVGRPFDVIMPYGFFYDIGRLFIIIGIIVLLFKTAASIRRRQFHAPFFLLVQLIGAGIVGMLVTVNITQINCAYIPLIMCEAIGICAILSAVGKRKVLLCRAIQIGLLAVYLLYFAGFEHAYYTDYKEVTTAHFQKGSLEAVRTALTYAKENQQKDIYIDSWLKYPNILLYTETTAKEYLDSVVYSENLPAPAQFTKDGVTFHMGIPDTEPQDNCIYILYEGATEKYTDFELTQFYSWYLAIPR